MMPRMYPPKPIPQTNTQSTATSAVSQPTVSTTNVTQTNVSPAATTTTIFFPPNAEEKTLFITNANRRYTFTSHGGGLKLIEIIGVPAITCLPKDSPAATNWASLNRGAALPVLAVTGSETLIEDGIFTLTQSTNGIRGEKRLTNGLVWIKDFESTSNNLLKATVRLENRSAQPITVPAQHWVAGTAAPISDDEGENLRGVYWYDGKSASHVDPLWFANRSGWNCIGVTTTPRT